MKPERNKTWIIGKDIAALLDVSLGAFQRNVQRMMDNDGFPLPSPHSLRPIMWRRVPVVRWIETQGYIQTQLDASPGDAQPGATVHHLRLASQGAHDTPEARQ